MAARDGPGSAVRVSGATQNDLWDPQIFQGMYMAARLPIVVGRADARGTRRDMPRGRSAAARRPPWIFERSQALWPSEPGLEVDLA